MYVQLGKIARVGKANMKKRRTRNRRRKKLKKRQGGEIDLYIIGILCIQSLNLFYNTM